MTLEELKAECEKRRAIGSEHIVLVAKSFPRAGFPRGELLCDNRGQKVRMYKVAAILKAIERIENANERSR